MNILLPTKGLQWTTMFMSLTDTETQNNDSVESLPVFSLMIHSYFVFKLHTDRAQTCLRIAHIRHKFA